MFNSNKSNDDDAESRLIMLMNENAELRQKNHQLENEHYQERKHMREHFDQVKEYVGKLKARVCEWVCPKCDEQYYGRPAIEAGSFKCIRKDCGSYCLPKELYINDSKKVA